MKKEELFETLSDIDEKKIKDARLSKRKGGAKIYKWATAIVAAAAIGLTAIFSPLFRNGGGIGSGGYSGMKTVLASYPAPTAANLSAEEFMEGDAHWDWWEKYCERAEKSSVISGEMLEYYKQALSAYLDPAAIEFDRYYPAFVYLRLMQVLGAYGFRGLIQKKAHFIESIPFAIKELKALNETYYLTEYPELQSVISQVVNLPTLNSKPSTLNPQLTVTVNSFSFKKGYPNDFSGNGGGFVFDCRALPNPGREPQFKTKTGRDREVIEYLEEKPQTHEFLDHVKAIVGQSIDNYLERHFNNLMLSFGCTGGQHRSVFFAQSIADWIKATYPTVNVILNHIEQHIYE